MAAASAGIAPAPFLIEGVDFDEIGAEVYKDEYIRIVASGGIPIYTGVGYTGDSFTYGLPYDVVCGAGGGLKTFDAVYRDILKPKITEKFTAENLNRISKSFLNSPPLNASNMKLLPQKVGYLMEESEFWSKTNKEGTKENRLNTRLKMSNVTRHSRMMRDPLYSSHIYFRAPSTWPHIEEAGVITLRENLKSCNLPDYHFNQPYRILFAGAEPGETATQGVVINVDPNQSYVFNSETRVYGVPAELIYSSKITLAEYLSKLRECGVGFVQPEMELYITPPDGFFPSNKFKSCIPNPTENTISIIDIASGETTTATSPEISPYMYQLWRNAVADYKKTNSIFHNFLVNSSNSLILLSELEDWINQNIPSNSGEMFKSYITDVKKIYTLGAPGLEELKSKLYPYYSLSLSVTHQELLDSIVGVKEKVKIHSSLKYILGEFNYFLLLKDFNKTIQRLRPATISESVMSELIKHNSKQNLINILGSTSSTESEKMMAEVALKNAEATEILMFINRLDAFFKTISAMVADIEPAPLWQPPSTARPSINISSIVLVDKIAIQKATVLGIIPNDNKKIGGGRRIIQRQQKHNRFTYRRQHNRKRLTKRQWIRKQ